jgi:Peptidase family M1 domain
VLKYLILFIFNVVLVFLNAQSNYFQQTVNYTIAVRLDDTNHTLHANETIEYINHSPQALQVIYMHLWPNAYRNEKTFLAKQLYKVHRITSMQGIDGESNGLIDSLNFLIDGKKIKWELCSGDSIDMARLFLNEPLLPESKISITTPFFVKIPDGNISRFGHDYQQYYITQWYPKPAVFDNKGWHVMPYLENGEYYGEFGTFDVTITLPKNYVVGATGNLFDNPQEEAFIENKILQTKNKTDFADNSFPLSNKENKILRFQQNNIHDFAWFCDKRYNVEKREVVLPVSNRVISCYAMYTNEDQMMWHNATSYMSDAMQKLSFWHGEYPFDKFTAVEGVNSAGADMEYPMLTIIGSQSSNQALDIVLMHEIAHTWFAHVFANNERQAPWIDEGIVSADELRYAEPKYPEYNFLTGIRGYNLTTSEARKSREISDKNKKKEGRYNFTYGYNYLYRLSQRKNIHQIVSTNSENFTDLNYARIVYFETAILFKHLRTYLGNDVFDDCMLNFFEKHKFKHIHIEDLRTVFETVSKKNLNWFFEDLVNTSKAIDYKLNGVKRAGTFYELKLKNKGQVNAPLFIDALNKNGEVISTSIIEGFDKDTTIKMVYLENIDRFSIDYKYFTNESYRKNNFISVNGLFKKIEPISLVPLTYIELPQKSQIFFSPCAGYNVHNGVMLGIALHNKALSSKRFEYLVMPMYATNSITPVGYANFAYNFNPKKQFQKLELGMDVKSYQAFSSKDIVFQSMRAPGVQTSGSDLPINIFVAGAAINYFKVAPYLDFKVKPLDVNSNISHAFGIKANYINYSLQADTILNFQNQRLAENINRTVFQLYYSLKNKNLRIPFTLQANSEIFRNSLSAEVSYRFYKYRQGMHLRLFAGTSNQQYIKTTSSNVFPYSKILNNDYGINSKNDFLFDDNYLGRYQSINTDRTLFNQWLLSGDGNVRIGLYDYLKNIYSTSEVISANYTLDIPKTWFSFYADVVMDKSIRISSESNTWATNYVLGIQLKYKDKLALYIPLNSSFNDKVNYEQKIAFKINLDLFNPFKLLDKEYNDNGR